MSTDKLRAEVSKTSVEPTSHVTCGQLDNY